jgi:hypothetical protein
MTALGRCDPSFVSIIRRLKGQFQAVRSELGPIAAGQQEASKSKLCWCQSELSQQVSRSAMPLTHY